MSLAAFARTPLPEGWPGLKRLVEAGFAHRRKTLANSFALSGVAPREQTEEALRALGRRVDARAEALEPAEFVALAGQLE